MESGEIWNNLKGFKELLGLIAWLQKAGSYREVWYTWSFSFPLYKRKTFPLLKNCTNCHWLPVISPSRDGLPLRVSLSLTVAVKISALSAFLWPNLRVWAWSCRIFCPSTHSRGSKCGTLCKVSNKSFPSGDSLKFSPIGKTAADILMLARKPQNRSAVLSGLTVTWDAMMSCLLYLQREETKSWILCCFSKIDDRKGMWINHEHSILLMCFVMGERERERGRVSFCSFTFWVVWLH